MDWAGNRGGAGVGSRRRETGRRRGDGGGRWAGLVFYRGGGGGGWFGFACALGGVRGATRKAHAYVDFFQRGSELLGRPKPAQQHRRHNGLRQSSRPLLGFNHVQSLHDQNKDHMILKKKNKDHI